MFTAWKASISRPTKDIDLLGKIENRIDVITSAMKKACIQKVEPDGMVFYAESVNATTITEDADYEGIRIRIQGNLGNARISLQIAALVSVSPPRMTVPTRLDTHKYSSKKR